MNNHLNKQFELANQYLEHDDYYAAKQVYSQILLREPDNARALHAMGVIVYKGWREVRKAVRLIRQALSFKSDFAEAYNNLAKILQENRRQRAAIHCYRQSVSIAPHNQIAWLNLAALFASCQQQQDAYDAFQAAYKLAPTNFDAVEGMARALTEMKSYDEALECYAKAQEISPDNATTYYNIAFIHKQLDHFAKSKDCLFKAIALNPDYAEAYRGLAEVLLCQGDADAAVVTIRKALALKPDFKDAHTFLLYALQYPSSTTQKDLFNATIEFCERFYSTVPVCKHYPNRLETAKKLRIGYISGEFHRHPVGFFFEQALAYHDPDSVTTYCYSNGQFTDWLTDRLKTYACTWRNISGLCDEAVVSLIQGDGVDILVDLSGHIGFGRVGVMARRPAPVQVSWIGYYNTLGLATVDYVIMDSDTLPVSLLPWFTERVVYMPETRFCYTPPSDSLVVKPLPALQNHHITFGCFNNVSKISPETIDVWSQILKIMPSTRLILKWGSFGDISVVERFKALFSANGVAGERVEYRGYSDYGTLLEEYGDIDIALDPFPFSGATTTCESLWMGVPVITLPGPLPAGRQTLALLKVIGLHEFIANSKEEYIQLAVKYASDLEALSLVRQRLRNMMLVSPLCDGKRFTAELMAAYRIMWQNWCEGSDIKQDKKPIEVPTAVPEATYNRGVKCLSSKRWHEAKRFFEQAIAVTPEFPEAYNNLGITYYYLGELEAAERALNSAIQLSPCFVDAYNNLGKVLTEQGKKRAALKAFLAVLEHMPNHHQAWCNLGELHQKAGRIAKARACFRKSLRYAPHFIDAELYLSLLYLKYNPNRGVAALRSLVMKYPESMEAHLNMVYAMHYDNHFSREDIFDEICVFGNKFYNKKTSVPTKRPSSFITRGERIKIGCVSADFHKHPVGVFFQAFAQYHDKSKFSLVCYNNSSLRDMITDDIIRCADQFRWVSGTTDDELISLIKEDGIDILIDLSGFTAGSRLSVFAQKPAAIQATWLGWFNTTGIKAIDYIVVDPVMVRTGEERYYVEKTIHLPWNRFCYTPPFLCPDVEVLPAIAKSYVTFGCFNNIAKITDQVVSVWASILLRVPQSRLVLKSNNFRDYEVRQHFIKGFKAYGVSSDRLELQLDSPHFFMLLEYNEIDIALDPFPHSGGLTSCEALWMGVPVVTLSGDLAVSRQTESFFLAMKVPGFVAQTEEEYISIAATWANHTEQLATLRAGLREKMRCSPLCNAKQFADDFGNLLHRMWYESQEVV